MFRMNYRIRKRLMEFANWCQNTLPRQNPNWPPWNHKSYHIFINNWDRNKIILPNHMFLVSSNTIKQTIQLFDIVIMQNSKWLPWNRHSDHIFVNNWDRDEIISPNHIFSLSRNAIKQTIPSLDIIIMQIQNGHHEITKLIIFALIIGIKTILFYQTICFRYQGIQ